MSNTTPDPSGTLRQEAVANLCVELYKRFTEIIIRSGGGGEGGGA